MYTRKITMAVISKYNSFQFCRIGNQQTNEAKPSTGTAPQFWTQTCVATNHTYSVQNHTKDIVNIYIYILLDIICT